MRLADSRRARIPFAVLGVLLLSGTVAVSVSMHGRDPGGTTGDVRASATRGAAAGETALRTAVREAAQAAARDPVVTPANTTAGRALNDSQPFRDALRVRIYLAARDALADVDATVGDASTTLSLPAVPSADGLAAAKRRVRLHGENGTLHVTLRDVRRLTTDASGATVHDDRIELTVAVDTPVLAVHRRVARYERRLSRAPTEGPGLGRRLTTRLYALAWTRGYAQYGQAPIANVVANRHVAFATNGGLVAEQRAVFGRSDPHARAARRRATAHVAVEDVVAATGAASPDRWADTVLASPPGPGSDPSPTAPVAATVTPDDPQTVSVGSAATSAFQSFVASDLDRVLDRTYSVRAERRVRVVPVRTAAPTPTVPGAGWERVNATRSRHTVVLPDEGLAAPDLPAPDRYGVARRRVRTNHTLATTWTRGNRTKRTTVAWTTVYRVAVAVGGRPAPGDAAPERPVLPIYRRGGPLQGPNLDLVPERVRGRLLGNRTRVDALARAAVRGGDHDRTVRLDAARPDGLREYVYRDLAGLREDLRAVSVAVRRGRLATTANAPRRLAARVRANRSRYVDAPPTYDGVAERARVAARAAYVDAVLAELDRRARAVERGQDGLRSLLASKGLLPDGGLNALVGMERLERPPRATVGDGLTAPTPLSVDGAPAYLTTTAVEGARAPGVDAPYYPLAAVNRNVFAYPYGDAADAVVGRFFDSPDRVPLRTAANGLAATNATADVVGNETLDKRRRALATAVGDAVAAVRDRTATRVAANTSLSEATVRAAVDAALASEPTLHERALALTAGDAADRVASEAIARGNVTDAVARDRIRLAVDAAIRGAVAEANARPKETPVSRAGEAARGVIRREAKSAVEGALKNGTERLQRRIYGEDSPMTVPSGLPVTPVPGSWYTTVNVWHVDVRGEYARFSVTAPRGSTAVPGARLEYVRDGGIVALDVDGDGDRERLGRADRVSFRTETVVLVAVPPGGTGVGDTDGVALEESPGWPCPGPDRPDRCGNAEATVAAAFDHVPRAAVRPRRGDARRAPRRVPRRPRDSRRDGRHRRRGRADWPRPGDRRDGAGG